MGMLDAWGDHPAVIETLKEASDALGEDLAKLIKDGPKEALALTTNTQPVMLVAAVAAYRVWMSETGVEPAAVAGHSLGEYSAMVAAGMLTLAQATPLVRYRAQAMQAAVPVGVGAMAAILGMETAKVIAGCEEATRAMRGLEGSDGMAGMGARAGSGSLNSLEIVEAVNFNDPGQTVIAGSKAAVDKACEILKANGAKRALLLAVSAPFHSSLMQPAAEKLKEKLESVEFASPRMPLLNNIDVAVEVDAERIRDALYRQAFGPVRWVECIQGIKARGISTVVECGPGKVLAGLVKRIDAEMTGLALFDPASLAEAKGILA